ncbi:MAG TPA: hypothetical protein PLE28_02770 [bacterium]|nr:hypothetical protein [bacterium]
MKAIKLVDLVEVLSSVSEGNIRNKAFSSELFEGFGIIEFSIKDMYFIFFTKKMNPILRDIASDNVFCQKILSIQKEARTMVINHGSGLFHILLCEIANPTSQFPAFEIDGLISATSRKLIRELASGHNCVATIIPNFKEKKDVDIKDAVDIFKNTSLILEEISKYAKDKKIGFSIFKISHFENIIQVI